jgi:hypothetical protein
VARDPYSVMRSLCRHAALVLGDDWNDVRPAEQEGTFDRPFALVERVGSANYSGSAQLRDVSAGFTISCYPRTDEDPDEAMRHSLLCEERLEDGFNSNIYGHGDVFRVPLYDYSGVPFNQSSERRGHCDYLRVTSFAINRIRDAEDQRLWLVAVDLRMGYRRLGRVPYGGRTATRVYVSEMDGR